MSPVALIFLAFVAAALPPEILRSILATATSSLFESTPFILAATLLARAPVRWSPHLLAYLGCGCTEGCSARSLPAAAATAIAFGPLVALARLAAAMFASRMFGRAANCDRGGSSSPLAQLASVAPFALIGGAIVPAWAGFGHTAPPPLAAIGGALLGFALAPCALGAASIAGALHAISPAATIGFLCVAGIADARALVRIPHLRIAHDAPAYALAAAATALVAWHHGAALVHPRFTWALWACALALALGAFVYRSARSPLARVAPALMLWVAVLGAPQPSYRAGETTLANAFAGERIDFTGVLTRGSGAPALVRYAITCCRADATPVVVRLQHDVAQRAGWLHANGTLVWQNNALVLHVESISAVSAPADPFVYR